MTIPSACNPVDERDPAPRGGIENDRTMALTLSLSTRIRTIPLRHSTN